MVPQYHPYQKVLVPTLSLPTVQVTLLLVLAFSSLLTACGGQPAPNAYSCGTPSSGHCYGVVSGLAGLIGSNILGNIYGLYGFQTAIYTAKLSGGDGFIDNEFWLNSNDCDCWIEVGYLSEPVLGTNYFWAQHDPTGLFVKHFLGVVPLPDYGQYGTYDIHQTGQDQFQGSIVNQATNYQFLSTNAMWTAHPYGFATEGQELAGTQGATAELAFYVFNSWYDRQGHRPYLNLNGSIQAANPPYADWFGTTDTPSATTNGGAFFTECCSNQV